MVLDNSRSMARTINILLTLLALIPLLATGNPIEAKHSQFTSRDNVDPGVELRILPLGDSITYGYASSDGNGYRLKLQQDLSGSHVLFVGSHASGTMTDGYNEGHNGNTISQIRGWATLSLPMHPNIILIHAGTNDLITNPLSEPKNQAITRLGNLLDQCHAADPDAVLLVAQIIGTNFVGDQGYIDDFNSHIPAQVQLRLDAGYKIMTVDMRSIHGNLIRADNVHPTDAGYQQMGDIWYQAIKTVVSKGWVKAPTTPDPPLGSGDHSKAGSNSEGVCKGGPQWLENELSAEQNALGGVGHEGPWKFIGNWQTHLNIADGLNLPIEGVHFADMDGDGRADYLWINETGGLVAWTNQVDINNPSGNQNNWRPANFGNAIIASGNTGARSQVFFNDMNGDFKTDYVVIKNNAVQIWFNEGYLKGHANDWNFDGGQTYNIPGLGNDPSKVWIADINGDLRDDIMLVGAGGALTQCWLNHGSPGSHDVTFVAQGPIAAGTQSNNAIAMYDIDGDKRDDYLVWDAEGGLSAYLNIRTARDGLPFYSAQGAKSFYPGLGISPTNIRLADIDGDGKVDYLRVYPGSGKVDWYRNLGAADTSRTGDGVFFADMNGDGLDDYLWVDINGLVYLYLNAGPNQGSPDGWSYVNQNGGKSILATGAKRHQIRFAKINADNKADVCVVTDADGSLMCYINQYTAGGSWHFDATPQIATGLGFGPNVRFADMDGDGRDDYIYVNSLDDVIQKGLTGAQSGAILVYKNVFDPSHPNTDWQLMPGQSGDGGHNLLAAGVGADPKEIVFHDLNGDGKAEYIWLHEIDGSVDAWVNHVGEGTGHSWEGYGFQVASGVIPNDPTYDSSGYHWSGQSVKFGHLTKSGRADYIAVKPENGALWVWFNSCDNLTPADPDDESNPPKAPAPLKAPTPTITSCSAGSTTTTYVETGVTKTTCLPGAITGCPPVPYNPNAPFGAKPPCASGAWLNVQCTDQGLTNVGTGPGRWDIADGPDAVRDVLAYWNDALAWNKQHPGSWELNFTETASNYFHYRDHINCDIEDPGSCSVTPLCSDTDHPAGWLFFEQITGLHDLYFAIYDGINSAINYVSDEMDLFAANFTASAGTATEDFNIGLDIVAIVASFGIATTFDTILADLAHTLAESVTYKSIAFNLVQDYLNAGIFTFAYFAKDLAATPQMPSQVAGDLSGILRVSANNAILSNRHFFTEQFNPVTPEQQRNFSNILNSEWLLAPELFFNKTQINNNLQRVFFGQAFNQVWFYHIQQTTTHLPFIMKVPAEYYTCGADISTAKALPGDRSNISWYISNDQAKQTSWCDANGNSYFLLGAADQPNDQSGYQSRLGTPELGWSSGTSSTPVTPLPGGLNNVLTPGNVWGGITIPDMVKSAWGGYAANRYQNNYTVPANTPDLIEPDLSAKPGTHGLPYAGGVLSPGFFNFPICTSTYTFEECGLDLIDSRNPQCNNYPCGLVGGPAAFTGNCALHMKLRRPNIPYDTKEKYGYEHGNPNPYYEIDLTLFDSNNVEVFGSWRIPLNVASDYDPNKYAITLPSERTHLPLPFSMSVSTDEHVHFSYGGETWDSWDRSHNCNAGLATNAGWENNQQQGDCGFSCSF